MAALKHPESVQPTLSLYSPSTHAGSISESYAAAIEAYIKTNPHRLLKTKKKNRSDWPAWIDPNDLITIDHFRSLMHLRYMRSLVEPGEAVGLLASQGFVFSFRFFYFSSLLTFSYYKQSWRTFYTNDS